MPGAQGERVAEDDRRVTEPAYSAGDILVSRADGAFLIARVSANGVSSHVLGYRTTEPAAILTAGRATSGYQRVFLQSRADPSHYVVVVEPGAAVS